MDEIISIFVWVFFIVIVIVKKIYTPEKSESFNKKNDNRKMHKEIVKKKQPGNNIILEAKKAFSMQKEQKAIENISKMNREDNNRDDQILNDANKSNKQNRLKKRIEKKDNDLKLQKQ